MRSRTESILIARAVGCQGFVAGTPDGENSRAAASALTICTLPEEQLPMIAKELLEILVCPVCKKPVVPSAAQDSLKCPQCRRVYPVRDDIPVMLVDEARVDEP